MKEMQATLDQKSAVIQGLVEKIADQVNTMTGNMQKITLAVDSVKSQTDKTSSELRTVLTDLSRNVTDVQEGLSSVRSQVNSMSQQVTTMRAGGEALDRPEDLLRTAAADMLAANYDLAISGYRDFLTRYATDPRAIEAELGIASALTKQNKHDQALVQYDLVLQKYPDSDKKKTALYYKGLAHEALDQIPEAISVLESVAKEYPGTIEGTSAKSKAASLRAARRRPRG
jgi:TolA-binding protein